MGQLVVFHKCIFLIRVISCFRLVKPVIAQARNCVYMLIRGRAGLRRNAVSTIALRTDRSISNAGGGQAGCSYQRMNN